MQIFHIRRWVIRMLYSVVDLGRQAVMECWRHTVSVEMPERSVRPAVLVIPGGGYSYISDRECEPVCAPAGANKFAFALDLHYLWTRNELIVTAYYDRKKTGGSRSGTHARRRACEGGGQ